MCKCLPHNLENLSSIPEIKMWKARSRSATFSSYPPIPTVAPVPSHSIIIATIILKKWMFQIQWISQRTLIFENKEGSMISSGYATALTRPTMCSFNCYLTQAFLTVLFLKIPGCLTLLPLLPMILFWFGQSSFKIDLLWQNHCHDIENAKF